MQEKGRRAVDCPTLENKGVGNVNTSKSSGRVFQMQGQLLTLQPLDTGVGAGLPVTLTVPVLPTPARLYTVVPREEVANGS